MRPALRIMLAAAALPLSAATAGLVPDREFHEPNAVIAGLTQADLNHIVTEAFRAGGGPSFEGRRDRLSRGLSDVSWSANLSEPVVNIADGGTMQLTMNILAADLHVGRFERKLLYRMASCDDLGVAVDPGHPVALSATLRLAIEDGGLRLIPEAVDLQDTEAFRLIKPSRCRNAPLPRWLLWQLGKPKLRQRLDGLDELILERLKASTADFGNGGDLRDKRWKIPTSDPSAAPVEFGLYPQTARTDGRKLLVALEASSVPPAGVPAEIPQWTAALDGRSFLALSRSFLAAVIRADYFDLQSQPSRPSTNFRRLLGSDQIRALIPGLARAHHAEDILVGLQIGRPPTIEFASTPEDPALIRVDLSGIELSLWEPGADAIEALGSLNIDSARVTLRPYLGPLGGVSFEIAENDWHVTAHGIETDEGTLAAVLQELVFGQVLGTHLDPLGRDALHIGRSQLVPTRFEVQGDHLIVDLAVGGRAGEDTQRAATEPRAGQALAVFQTKR